MPPQQRGQVRVYDLGRTARGATPEPGDVRTLTVWTCPQHGGVHAPEPCEHALAIMMEVPTETCWQCSEFSDGEAVKLVRYEPIEVVPLSELHAERRHADELAGGLAALGGPNAGEAITRHRNRRASG